MWRILRTTVSWVSRAKTRLFHWLRSLVVGEYPDNCLRGIPSKEQIVVEGGAIAPHSDVFRFTDTRANGDFTQSINWKDDRRAIAFTLAQTNRDGGVQFRGGVAVVSRIELDRISKLPTIGQALSYDRERLDDNPYHGNLVLAAGVSPTRRKMIQATLATHSQVMRP
jgi:hypothetical protein